ncbi:MAG: DUF6786 family protein [Bacteroidaceae bacterium]
MKKKSYYLILIIIIASAYSIYKKIDSTTNNRDRNSKLENIMTLKMKPITEMVKGQFEYDLAYLKDKDPDLLLLTDPLNKGIVILSPKFQGKVFTSTSTGLTGRSLGWVNYNAFEAEKLNEHINAYGGEDRLWIGPEGGQYSIFFKAGNKQDFANWKTPSALDTEAWQLISSSTRRVVMSKDMMLKNYIGTTFDISVERAVTLLDKQEIDDRLGMKIPNGVNFVAYNTQNSLTNKNKFEWTPKTGALCIWMLDMCPTNENAYTLLPYIEGDEETLGQIVKSNYFGEIPASRLQVQDGTIYFKTDGRYRSKLGVKANRTLGIAGNYDLENKRLNIITFSVNKHQDATYLNQSWDPDQNPLVGCALNAYNDGPLEDGSQMGPFLELESVSPAAFLKPEEQLTHTHTVYHFSGDEAALDSIMKNLLHTSIDKIQKIALANKK